MAKHWTLRKASKRPSMYIQTLGRPELRSLGIEALYGDLERARAQGNQGYERAVTNELHALGEGDYIPGFDDGNGPIGYQFN